MKMTGNEFKKLYVKDGIILPKTEKPDCVPYLQKKH